MNQRDLMLAFQSVCATKGNWQLALRGVASPPQPEKVSSAQRFAVVGSAVHACQAAAAHGWMEASVVFASLWNQAFTHDSPNMVEPDHRRLDLRCIHVVLDTCARAKKWEVALGFVEGSLMTRRGLWMAERADVVRDAVLTIAAAAPHRNPSAWQLGLEALQRIGVRNESKPVSIRALERFVAKHVVANVGYNSEAPRQHAVLALRKPWRDEWREAMLLLSAATAQPQRRGGKPTVDANGVNAALQILSASPHASADTLLLALHSLSKLNVVCSRGTAMALSLRASADQSPSIVPVAIFVLRNKAMFPDHSLSAPSVIPFMKLLRLHGKLRVIVDWFNKLPPRSHLRGVFRVAAPVSSSMAALGVEHGGGWVHALTLLARIMDPAVPESKVIRASIVALRVASQWELAVQLALREGNEGWENERAKAARDALLQSRDIWAKVLHLTMTTPRQP